MALLQWFTLTALVGASVANPFQCPSANTIEMNVEEGEGSPAKLCEVADFEPIYYENAHDVEPHSYPWIVSIQYRDFVTGTTWKPVCTGTLISPTVLLMHAGCVLVIGNGINTLDWLMVLGAQNVSVLANIDTSVPTVSYNNSYYDGFFTIAKGFPENPFINHICVRRERFPAGYDNCYVAGWKYTGLHIPPDQTSNMVQARMIRVSNSEYENATGDALFSGSTVATPVDGSLTQFDSDNWWNGRPLMCRNWCNGNTGQWYLEGYAVRAVKSLSKTKTYVVFDFYTRILATD